MISNEHNTLDSFIETAFVYVATEIFKIEK